MGGRGGGTGGQRRTPEDGKNYYKDVNRVLRVRKIKTARKHLKDMPKAPPSALAAFVNRTRHMGTCVMWSSMGLRAPRIK